MFVLVRFSEQILFFCCLVRLLKICERSNLGRPLAQYYNIEIQRSAGRLQYQKLKMADGIVVADIKRRALKAFSHLSLNGQQREIRVLELHAGEYDDSIACSLRLENLDDVPNYEALSYVWGDPGITTDISLNGQNFGITTNLAASFDAFAYLIDLAYYGWMRYVSIRKIILRRTTRFI